MDDYWSNLRRSARQFGTEASSYLSSTAADIQSSTQEAGQVFRRSMSQAGQAIESAAKKTAEKLDQGIAAVANALDDEPLEGPELQARPAAPDGWTPTVPPRQPPRLEQLKKGDKVFRRGQAAEVVKIDYEADPAALVVRMLEGANEVGTDGANASLGLAASGPCLGPGVRVCVVALKSRADLNGARGVLTDLSLGQGDVYRWSVRLDKDGEVVACRPRNLSVLLAPPLRPASVQETRRPQAPVEQAVEQRQHAPSQAETKEAEAKPQPSAVDRPQQTSSHSPQEPPQEAPQEPPREPPREPVQQSTL